MNIKYDIATKDDIDELIRLRIAYMMDDFGSVTDEERAGMEKQLPDYFERKLGTELVAFVARDEDRDSYGTEAINVNEEKNNR